LASERQIAADLLSRVLSGGLRPEEAEAHWPGNEADDPSLHAAMHALQHYRVDADIRAKDRRYAALQTAELAEIARHLSLDEDVDQAVLDYMEPRPGCLFKLLGTGSRPPG
jgi:hypothetical protein